MSTLDLVRRLSHGPLLSDSSLVSPSGQARIAAAYAALPDRVETDVDAWHRMAEEVRDQHRLLTSHGFTFTVRESDPYPTHHDMFNDVFYNRHIAVMSTATTGHHPLFTDEVNDMFRAVHDVFGHFAAQRGFDRHGEEAAYRRHALMFSRRASRAMATETRGQNAALVANGGVFQAQRIAILPAWALHPYFLTPNSPAEWREARTHSLSVAV